MAGQPKLIATLKAHSNSTTHDWSELVEFALGADEGGLDQLAISDHVAFGENLEAYSDPSLGGRRGGVQPTGSDGLWLDPLATIAYISALTQTVRFGTSILIAALRRPITLAKTAATIDVLSNGRLEIGVGVGWQREEYEAAGLRFADRGRLLNETLEICQQVWRNQRASYEGENIRFNGIHQMPKPVQRGGVPIWVSGTVNTRAMERLARFGSGWIPWGEDASDTFGGIERMRTAVANHGRDPLDLGIMARIGSISSTDLNESLSDMMQPVPGLMEAGVTDFRIDASPPPGRHATAEFFASVVDAFRAATGRPTKS
jgi:probable F420-dependent oxidoreductase